MSDQTIEQRLDEILNTHLQDFKAGHDDKFRDSFLQLLNEARTKGYSDGFQMGQFERDMDNIHGIEELTPKENK